MKLWLMVQGLMVTMVALNGWLFVKCQEIQIYSMFLPLVVKMYQVG